MIAYLEGGSAFVCHERISCYCIASERLEIFVRNEEVFYLLQNDGIICVNTCISL